MLFVTGSYFNPKLIFVCKAGESPISGSSLACKYNIRVEVTYSDKHSSLLGYGVNYSQKKLYKTGPLGLYYKTGNRHNLLCFLSLAVILILV